MERGLQRFVGKTAVITGGATGVGFATAERLASKGARVVISGRRADVGGQACDSLRSAGYEVSFVAADVAQEDQVSGLMDETVRLYGGIHILVNNAAMFVPAKFMDTQWDEWRKVFDVIVSGAYFCTKEAARRMIGSRTAGSIVNVSSINSSSALEESSHYNAAKGALDQLTRNTSPGRKSPKADGTAGGGRGGHRVPRFAGRLVHVRSRRRRRRRVIDHFLKR